MLTSNPIQKVNRDYFLRNFNPSVQADLSTLYGIISPKTEKKISDKTFRFLTRNEWEIMATGETTDLKKFLPIAFLSNEIGFHLLDGTRRQSRPDLPRRDRGIAYRSETPCQNHDPRRMKRFDFDKLPQHESP